MIKLIKTNNVINFLPILGLKIALEKSYLLCSSIDLGEKCIYVGEYENNIGNTNRISLVDQEKALKILEVLGYEIEVENGFSFSQETKTKAKALVIAGFTKLVKDEYNYTVDGIFQQNFLTKEEVDYLLLENKEEFFLKEIV